MNAVEWDACNAPERMLAFLGGLSERRARLFAVACCRRIWHLMSPDRFERLAQESKWLGGWDQLESISRSVGHLAIEAAERFADDQADREAMHALSEQAFLYELPAAYYAECFDDNNGQYEYDRTVLATGDAAWAASSAAQRFILPADVALHCARAVGEESSKAPWGGNADEDLAERAAQCILLRDIAGNPFTTLDFDCAWCIREVVLLAQEMYDASDFQRMTPLESLLQQSGCNEPVVLSHCRQSTHVRGCWLIDAILGKSERGNEMERLLQKLEPGDLVEIVPACGAWSGKRGVIQSTAPDVGRVRLFFDHFGRTVPCEIEARNVEKLDNDAWDDDLLKIRVDILSKQ